MTEFERPAPDLDKIAEAWATWQAQGDEVLPGRTMADLKIGGVDRVLQTLREDNDGSTIEVLDRIDDIWQGWERGKVGPHETLAALIEAGFADFVEALTAT